MRDLHLTHKLFHLLHKYHELKTQRNWSMCLPYNWVFRSLRCGKSEHLRLPAVSSEVHKLHLSHKLFDLLHDCHQFQNQWYRSVYLPYNRVFRYFCCG